MPGNLNSDVVVSGPAVSYVRRMDGGFAFLGEGTRLILGSDPQAILAKAVYWSAHLHPEDRAEALSKLRNLKAGQALTLEYRFLRPAGPTVWLHDALVVEEQDGQLICRGVLSDITDRKQYEADLAESEKRYRRVSDNVRDLVMQVDLNSKAYYASPSHKDVLGIRAEDMVGMTAYDLVHPDDMDNIMPIISECITRRESTKFEYRSRHADGHYIWTEANANLLTEEDGSISGAILVTRDITEKKEAEAALRQARDDLEEKVCERTAELSRANQDLETKNCELEELNTALNVLLRQREKDRANLEENIMANINGLIMPYVEKIKRAKLDERTQSCLQTVEDHLTEIVSDFSRQLTSSYTSLTPREIQIASLIREGRDSKEIAALLDLSLQTVEFHRNNLRKKLNISNRKVNLRSYLLSLK